MGLNRLTDRIYYLEHEPETDRPMLAYIRGDKWSLAIDAGYSSSHVADFYRAIEAEHLKKPDFTVIALALRPYLRDACGQRGQHCP